jgi:hypothetical protein
MLCTLTPESALSEQERITGASQLNNLVRSWIDRASQKKWNVRVRQSGYRYHFTKLKPNDMNSGVHVLCLSLEPHSMLVSTGG